MVMVALTKVHAPVAVPRSELAKYAVQVYFKTARLFWVTKPVILRNPPYTIFIPHKRQAMWRQIFAAAAKYWKGAKGTGTLKYDSRSGKHKAGDVVLAVQAKAQEVLKKVYAAVKDRLPAAVPREKYRRTPHKAPELSRYSGVAYSEIESMVASALAGAA